MEKINKPEKELQKSYIIEENPEPSSSNITNNNKKPLTEMQRNIFALFFLIIGFLTAVYFFIFFQTKEGRLASLFIFLLLGLLAFTVKFGEKTNLFIKKHKAVSIALLILINLTWFGLGYVKNKQALLQRDEHRKSHLMQIQDYLTKYHNVLKNPYPKTIDELRNPFTDMILPSSKNGDEYNYKYINDHHYELSTKLESTGEIYIVRSPD